MREQDFRDQLIVHMAKAEEQMKRLNEHVVGIKHTLDKGDIRMDKIDARLDNYDKQISFLRGVYAVVALIFTGLFAWMKK